MHLYHTRPPDRRVNQSDWSDHARRRVTYGLRSASAVMNVRSRGVSTCATPRADVGMVLKNPLGRLGRIWHPSSLSRTGEPTRRDFTRNSMQSSNDVTHISRRVRRARRPGPRIFVFLPSSVASPARQRWRYQRAEEMRATTEMREPRECSRRGGGDVIPDSCALYIQDMILLSGERR